MSPHDDTEAVARYHARVSTANATLAKIPAQPKAPMRGKRETRASEGSAMVTRIEPWESRVSVGEHGAHATVGNCALILSNAEPWRGVIAFDERASAAVLRLPPPWESTAAELWTPSPITDVDTARVAIWLAESKWTIRVSPTAAPLRSAIDVVANGQRFDPVRDYLDALVWDGIERLADLAHRYFGHPDDHRLAFAQIAWPKWTISCVARVYEPGCQCDHAIVLVGSQGRGKSTALRELVGRDGWFLDDLSTKFDRDTSESLLGPWVVELGELERMTRGEVGALKAFVTRREDKYRSAYAYRTEAHPRRCVFAGSVNDDAFLRDATGNRRWWPVTIGRIDVDAIRRDRDQLWAEAVHRYRSGEPWHLTEATQIEGAQAAQEERYQGDPWEELIGAWLDGQTTASVTEILLGACKVEPGRWGQAEANRVARVMQRLGWRRQQLRASGRREWRYLPPSEGGEDV